MHDNAPWKAHLRDLPFHIEYPDSTLWQCFEKAAARWPRFSALSCMGKEYSYSLVSRRINETARAFKAAGVKKGTVVALCLPNLPQTVYCLYALNMIGAVACMIHPLSAPNELTELFKEAGCDMAVIMDSFGRKFEDAEKKLPHIKYIVTHAAEELGGLKSSAYKLINGRKHKGQSPENAISWSVFIKDGKGVALSTEKSATSDETAVIMFSGGTTGVPKAIALSNYNVNALACQTNAVCKAGLGGKRMLAVLPMFHGFGLGVCVHTPLIHGATAILVPRINPDEFGSLLVKTKANFFAGVPTLFEALIRSKNGDRLDLSGIYGAYCGGDSMSVDLKRRVNAFLKRQGATVRVQEGYGATECVAASCLTPYFSTDDEGIGFPFPDTYYKICAVGSTDDVPYGTDGEICLRGPTVMLGYIGHEEENAATLKRHGDGYTWLHTGDMGCMDETGRVYFRQRIKRMIVTSGYNVYPSRIESIISDHPKIKECCVIGVSDPYKIQKIKAFAVAEDSIKADDALKAELLEYCKKRIARYSMPYDIEFIKSLPRTKLNKVDYKALEEEYK